MLCRSIIICVVDCAARCTGFMIEFVAEGVTLFSFLQLDVVTDFLSTVEIESLLTSEEEYVRNVMYGVSVF